MGNPKVAWVPRNGPGVAKWLGYPPGWLEKPPGGRGVVEWLA